MIRFIDIFFVRNCCLDIHELPLAIFVQITVNKTSLINANKCYKFPRKKKTKATRSFRNRLGQCH